MKISVIGYQYQEPFSKEQVPNKIGSYGPFFQEVEFAPDRMKDYIKNNIVWSPFLFDGGVRLGSKNKMLMDCWVFDYDDGVLTPDEIIKLMRKIEYFSWADRYQIIFAGSPRNSDTLHKYRIIIPFGETLKIDENYTKVYAKMIKDLKEVGLPLDGATKDLARMFYSVDFCEVTVNTDDIIPKFRLVYNNVKARVREEDKLRFLDGVYSRKPRMKGQIKPEHLVKKPLYQRYRAAITPTTAHLGVAQLVGYLKKSGCLITDIKDHVWECMVQSGGLRSYTEYEREIKGLL